MTATDPETAGFGTVRVVVADDSPDIRMMLRLLLGRDSRFAVVGEAANGQEAIEVASDAQPDLLVLDRQMPILGGLEAMPAIRAAAPHTDIVLYTTDAEEETQQLALSAGAIGLLEKRALALTVVEELAGILARHWADPAAQVDIRVGPVASHAARLWVESTQRLLDALGDNPAVLDPLVPDAVIQRFGDLVRSWGEVAAATDVFMWVGRASAS